MKFIKLPKMESAVSKNCYILVNIDSICSIDDIYGTAGNYMYTEVTVSGGATIKTSMPSSEIIPLIGD